MLKLLRKKVSKWYWSGIWLHSWRIPLVPFYNHFTFGLAPGHWGRRAVLNAGYRNTIRHQFELCILGLEFNGEWANKNGGTDGAR